MDLLVSKEVHTTSVPQQSEEKKLAPAPSSRAELYRQYFSEHSPNTSSLGGFIHQVDGYGVQLFTQASSFTAR